MTRVMPQTTGTPSDDQSVSIRLEGEILTDADTGQYQLIITTGIRTYDECTPEELRATIADVREQLQRMEALADRYDAITGASK